MALEKSITIEELRRRNEISRAQREAEKSTDGKK